MDHATLTGLRRFCLTLPNATETDTWGHQQFRIENKIFCATGFSGVEDSIAFKVGKDMQGVFLQDPRFFKTPYIGQHGWVSLRVVGKLDWVELEELINSKSSLRRAIA